jgi:hypothetical protein
VQRGGAVISWAQIKIWLILAAMTIVGAAGSVYYGSIPEPWFSHIVEALCPPIFTAGILGLTVDAFLKRELARDVFVAAFRYILPEELKEEVRRIIGYTFLCTESTSVVSITEAQHNLLKVQISHERILRNITAHSEPISARFSIDEWGFDEHSQIEECYLESDGAIKVATDNPDFVGKVDAIAKRSDMVSVKPGLSVRVVYRGYEIHRKNSEIHMEFSNPTTNPTVRVETPQGISHSCTFGIPGEKIIQSAIAKQYKLEGTQFPGQHTRIRWWPSPATKTSS